MPHQNRSKRDDNPARTPKPDEMRAAREANKLSPAEAGKLCFSTGQWWEDCELGRKRCHPAIWQYWLSRVDPIAQLAAAASRRYIQATLPLVSDKGVLYKQFADQALDLIEKLEEQQGALVRQR
jgi:hypothetical protein